MPASANGGARSLTFADVSVDQQSGARFDVRSGCSLVVTGSAGSSAVLAGVVAIPASAVFTVSTASMVLAPGAVLSGSGGVVLGVSNVKLQLNDSSSPPVFGTFLGNVSVAGGVALTGPLTVPYATMRLTTSQPLELASGTNATFGGRVEVLASGGFSTNVNVGAGSASPSVASAVQAGGVVVLMTDATLVVAASLWVGAWTTVIVQGQASLSWGTNVRLQSASSFVIASSGSATIGRCVLVPRQSARLLPMCSCAVTSSRAYFRDMQCA